MRIHKILLVTAIFVLIPALIWALPKRVSQIPNGSKLQCSNCHINPAGGGAHTPFGEVIKADYLDGNGDVIWGSSLASLDSDGDGFTNGQELQDQNGTWMPNDPAPGEFDLVSNPGDDDDFPVSVVENLLNSKGKSIKITNTYPNPMENHSEIAFELNESSRVRASVYSAEGVRIAEFFNSYISAGNYTINWDGKRNDGIEASPGTYFIMLSANGTNSAIPVRIVR